MTERSRWLEEFSRLVVLFLAASVVGFAVNNLPVALLLAALAYVLHNFVHLKRLADWLGDPQDDKDVLPSGLWGEVYDKVIRIQAHHDQREARLTTMLNEYARSTAALPDGAVALDAENRIRWFNDAASQLLGLQTAKDIGQPLIHLLRTPELADVVKHRRYDQILQVAAPQDRERTLEVRINAYGEGQVLLLAQDITDRLRQERVRKDFVANVSHELRTPLTVLGGFVENLQLDDRITADDTLRRPLELMEQQTTRMRQIVEDLLTLARLESDSAAPVRQPIDVREMMRSIAEECQSLAEDGPRIDVRSTSVAHLLGDPKQLRSALTNLVVNAIHHTPEAGQVLLSWDDDDVGATLAVADTGEGIEAEHLNRLTERFYRVDKGRSRERGGTGLGLAIVKHIVQRHEGRLRIESEPGRGSRFSIAFAESRLHSVPSTSPDQIQTQA